MDIEWIIMLGNKMKQTNKIPAIKTTFTFHMCLNTLGGESAICN